MSTYVNTQYPKESNFQLDDITLINKHVYNPPFALNWFCNCSEKINAKFHVYIICKNFFLIFHKILYKLGRVSIV